MGHIAPSHVAPRFAGPIILNQSSTFTKLYYCKFVPRQIFTIFTTDSWFVKKQTSQEDCCKRHSNFIDEQFDLRPNFWELPKFLTRGGFQFQFMLLDFYDSGEKYDLPCSIVQTWFKSLIEIILSLHQFWVLIRAILVRGSFGKFFFLFLVEEVG